MKKPEDLSILEVVNAVDPVERILTCPLNLPSHGETLCPLHRRMDHLIGEMETAFRETSLMEILLEASPSAPLCHDSHAAFLKILENEAPSQDEEKRNNKPNQTPNA